MSKDNTALLRQSLVALSNGLAALGASYALAFPSPALSSMDRDPNFLLTEDESSWIGSIVPGAALLGSLIAGPLVEVLGRHRLVFLFIPLVIACWMIIALSPTVLAVIGARFVSGICVGVQNVAGSVYVSECVEGNWKALLNLFPAVLGTSGFFVANAVGKFLDWRGVAWVGATLGVTHLLLHIFLPETPYFLLKTGNRDKSLKIMAWLRNNKTTAQKEVQQLARSFSNDSNGKNIQFKELFLPPNRWPVLVAISLHFFQQTTGIAAVTSYSNFIFEATEAPFDSSTCSIVMTSVNVAATLLSSYLVTIITRRSLIKMSCQAVILSSLSIWGLLYFKSSGSDSQLFIFAYSHAPILFILVYVAFFAIGWGPVPFIFLGEGLPTKVRGLGCSLAISINWIFNFLVSKTFFSLQTRFGMSSTFLIYAMFSLVGLVVVEYFLPETLNKTDDEMDKFYTQSYKVKYTKKHH